MVAKKKNPQNSTVRNTRAANRRFTAIEARLWRLEKLLAIKGNPRK